MLSLVIDHTGLLVILLCASLLTGFMAGLFGIGGGAIIVPVLYTLFSSLGYGSQAMHVSLATSLAVIIITSVRSVSAHHRRLSVDWSVLRAWVPWIMLGAVCGQLLAARLSAVQLTIVFCVLAYLLSLQLFFGRPNWRLADDLPNGGLRAGLGVGIGGFSTLMGIGGGTFGVTLMTLCGRPMTSAVATAAGFGAAIGFPSAITAIVTGWSASALPPGSLGYVNIPAFLFVATFTTILVPFGARAAYALNKKTLKRLFALLLFLVASRMLVIVLL